MYAAGADAAGRPTVLSVCRRCYMAASASGSGGGSGAAGVDDADDDQHAHRRDDAADHGSVQRTGGCLSAAPPSDDHPYEPDVLAFLRKTVRVRVCARVCVLPVSFALD